MPGITYQVGLYLGDRFCRGASLPGVPGVTMGQNNDVAWSFTNVMADVMDLFIERIKAGEYERDGEGRPVEVIEEEIAVKGQAWPDRLIVRQTESRPDRERGSSRRRCGAARPALLRAGLPRDHEGQLRGPRLRERAGSRRRPGRPRAPGIEPRMGRSPRIDRLQDGRPDPAAPRRLPGPPQAGLVGRVRVGTDGSRTTSCPRRTTPSRGS